MVLEQLDIRYKTKKEGLDINLHPSQKFTEKKTDHRTKHKTMKKLLEDNLREDLDDSDRQVTFRYNTIGMIHKTKNWWARFQEKTLKFFSAKDIVKKMQNIVRDRQKTFSKTYLVKGYSISNNNETTKILKLTKGS